MTAVVDTSVGLNGVKPGIHSLHVSNASNSIVVPLQTAPKTIRILNCDSLAVVHRMCPTCDSGQIEILCRTPYCHIT